MKTLVIFLLTLIACTALAQPDSCIIAGQSTHLTGTISMETFPGLPNYESIKAGDEPETYWILTTDQPYCGEGEDFSNEGQKITEKNETRFQLVLTADQYKEWNALLSKKVSVEGSMFLAHTGHHHTPMLIEVTKMNPVK